MLNNDLVGLITRGHEAPDLDYKGPMRWNKSDKKACCELVKDIMAMANHGGGWLVVGVPEPSFVPQGMTEDEAATFESTKVHQVADQYSDPPVRFSCKIVPFEDRYYVVIGVEGFKLTPHICVKPFHDDRNQLVLSCPTIYVRSEAHQSAAVSRASELSSLIERAVRNRQGDMLKAWSTVLRGEEPTAQVNSTAEFEKQAAQAEEGFSKLAPSPPAARAYCTMVAHPETFAADRFAYEDVLKARVQASEDFTGWPFFYVDHRGMYEYNIGDGIESNVAEDYFGRPAHDFYQIRESGLIYHRELLSEVVLSRPKGQPLLAFDWTVKRIALGVRAAAQLYGVLVDEGEPIRVRFALDGVVGTRIGSADPGRDIRRDYTAHIDTVQVEQRLPLIEWKADTPACASRMAKRIFQQFNWMDVSDSVLKEIAENVFKRRLG